MVPSSAFTDVLLRFDPITLEEMDNVKLQDRVDTKYVLSAAMLPQLLKELLPNYRLLHVHGRPGTDYRSLYFDTPDLRHFLDHHNGRTHRCKVRFREYLGSDLAFLEVKRKTGGGRTDKARMRVPGIPSELSPELNAFVAKASGREEALVPTLWNHFTRYTLVNRHSPERLTLDVDLRFSTPSDQKALGPIVVAELKQGRADRNSPFVQAMRRYHIRPAGMSKYCIGMLMVGRTTKYNAFKPVLLNLDRLRSAATTFHPSLPPSP